MHKKLFAVNERIKYDNIFAKEDLDTALAGALLGSNKVSTIKKDGQTYSIIPALHDSSDPIMNLLSKKPSYMHVISQLWGRNKILVPELLSYTDKDRDFEQTMLSLGRSINKTKVHGRFLEIMNSPLAGRLASSQFLLGIEPVVYSKDDDRATALIQNNEAFDRFRNLFIVCKLQLLADKLEPGKHFVLNFGEAHQVIFEALLEQPLQNNLDELKRAYATLDFNQMKLLFPEKLMIRDKDQAQVYELPQITAALGISTNP